MFLEMSVLEQKYQAVLAVVSDGHPVVEVAQRYGVSRQSLHTWLRRYEDKGLDGLAAQSRRPHHSPLQMPASIEAEVLELRRLHPSWGPRRILHELQSAALPARGWRRPQLGKNAGQNAARDQVAKILQAPRTAGLNDV